MLHTAQGLLDEGLKSLATRQKYNNIKIVDLSEYGWVTVKHCQDDPLASDSEDEKNLGRVEKEARKDAKCQASKHQHGKKVTASKRPRQGQGFDQPGASTSELPATTSGAMQPPRHPRAVSVPLRPCWRCGAFGHLAANCTVTKSYPLFQPVVSSADVSTLDKVELSLYDGGVNSVAA